MPNPPFPLRPTSPPACPPASLHSHSVWSGAGVGAGFALLAAITLNTFIQAPWLTVGICVAGVIIFTMYLMLDLQMVRLRSVRCSAVHWRGVRYALRVEGGEGGLAARWLLRWATCHSRRAGVASEAVPLGAGCVWAVGGRVHGLH